MEPTLLKLVSDFFNFGGTLQSNACGSGVTQTCLEIPESAVQMHPEAFGGATPGIQDEKSRSSVRLRDEERLRFHLIAKERSRKLRTVVKEMVERRLVMRVPLKCRRNIHRPIEIFSSSNGIVVRGGRLT